MFTSSSASQGPRQYVLSIKLFNINSRRCVNVNCNKAMKISKTEGKVILSGDLPLNTALKSRFPQFELNIARNAVKD